MATRSSKGLGLGSGGGAASTSATTSSAAATDASQHPGFVNLGNTCFLNSALQAISATQSLKQLYLPGNEEEYCAVAGTSPYDSDTPQVRSGSTTPAAAPSSRRASLATELLQARSKSPVLRLADEEHGRRFGQASTVAADAESHHRNMEASISAIAQQAVANPTPADMQTIQRTATKDSNGLPRYSPTASDLPLNTAFRHVLERSWQSTPRSADKKASSSKSSAGKVASINPKPLLNEISSKYDQYSEYRQQDGHELLRHLLDSLRMEELDVIRKIRPPAPPSKRRRKVSTVRTDSLSYTGEGGKLDHQATTALNDQLKPLVDNLFCGKLLSFVVCEGCRHVSHTYEDFYDISLSLRPDAEAKDSGKRRIRSMADRWRRTTAANKPASATDIAKPLVESLTMLREDSQAGSYSDTEQAADEPIRRSSSRLGRSISRPRSAADRARIDANSKEGAKTFIKRQMERQQTDSVDVATAEKSMESMSLTPMPDKRRDPTAAGGAAALLRAVSGRRTPSGNSPLRRDGAAEGMSDPASTEAHEHGHRFGHHHKKPAPSKHTEYIAKLLAEAPVAPPQQANLGALLWGRKTPVSSAADLAPSTHSSPDAGHAAGKKHEVDFEAQQANTGLVRALYQFTTVEVLDGSNSFACKRCWRLLNPPSAKESEKLRLRRLRRGKEEDESERSSDDDSSSDEEAKENRQRFALSEQRKSKQEERQRKKDRPQLDALLVRQMPADSTASSLNGSSVSSLASLSSDAEDEQLRGRSTGAAVAERAAPPDSLSDNDKPDNDNQRLAQTAPALVVVPSDIDDESLETPKQSDVFSVNGTSLQSGTAAVRSVATSSNGIIQQPSASVPSTRAPPLLKAPKPILASSVATRLADTVSPGASSDEGGSGEGLQSSDEDSDAEVARSGTRLRSIRYADDDEHASGFSGITKPANSDVTTAPEKPLGKRSAHSLQRRALKRFLVAETPKVFVFHFKRFQATGRGFSFATSFKKIDDYISFPEYLDVKPWLAPPREEYDRHGKLKKSSDARALLAHQRASEHGENGKDRHGNHHHLWHHRWHHNKHAASVDASEEAGGPQTKYRLYGVVVHQGSMSGGHYTAFVLSDRASDSLKAKAANGPEAAGSRKVSSASTTGTTSEAAASRGKDVQQNGSVNSKSSNGALHASSLKSTATTADEGSVATTASTPSPLAASSSTRVEALSSVSSLGSNIGEAGSFTPLAVDQHQVPPPPPHTPKVDERRWIYASDTLVRAASIDEVLKAQAYMLFYEQM